MSERSDMSRRPEKPESLLSRDDSDLVLRCQSGNEDSFRTLFNRYHRRVFGVAYKILGNPEPAIDAVQQSFIQAFRHIREFDPGRSFYSWLYQIVVNQCIDQMRQESRRVTMPFDEILDSDRHPARFDGPERSVARHDLRQKVRKCLDRLPMTYKGALVLHDLEGLSCEQTAEIMGCPNPTARWRIHYARKLFKSIWLGEGEEVDRSGIAENNS